MTRAAVVLALLVALTFAARSFSPEGAFLVGSGAALAFGFLICAAVQVGRIFDAFHLPQLTGFILCGVVFGPEVVKLVTPAMVHDLEPVRHVTVGLIGLLAGCELNLRSLKPRLRGIAAFLVSGLAVAFVTLFAFFLGASPFVPSLSAMPLQERLMVALLCANAYVALSPPVVMGIISETRSSGPLSEMALSIAILADLVVVTAFALTNFSATRVFSGQVGASGLRELAVHVFGSLGVGLAVGAVLAIYLRRVRRRASLFIFALFFALAEAGVPLGVDPLLAGLAAGLFLENVSPLGGREVIRQTEPASQPTFTVFFAVVGAQLAVHEFMTVAILAVSVAAVRGFGIWVGTRAARGLSGASPEVAGLVHLGMLPQAGIALALATLIKSNYPGWGGEVGTLLVGGIIVNELLGPVLFRAALGKAGETGRRSVPDEAPVPEAPAAANA